MSKNEHSKYLYEQYDAVLGEQLKAAKSQYVLSELNRKPADDQAEPKAVDSEYVLRTLQTQHQQNPNISRDAPNREFLTGVPVNAKEIRNKIESLDNSIVIPLIINGQLFFITHGEADATTAVEGSLSNPNVAATEHLPPTQEHVNLKDVKFTFPQLVRLLGPNTCQRLEREFVKQNKLSEAELNQLKTARESVSQTDNVQARESNSLSARTPTSTKSPNVLTAQPVEPNLLSVHTANSVEPNLLSVYSAKSPGPATKIFAKSPGIHTANSVEPNLLSTQTANSVEPNLLSVYSAKSPGVATKIFSKSPGIHTANPLEPNLLSTQTARSQSNDLLSGRESTDVQTCIEIGTGMTTCRRDTSSKDVQTARSIISTMSNEDIRTAIESVRSSQDVTTAVEIVSSISSSSEKMSTAQESVRSSQDVKTALEIGGGNVQGN